MEMVTDLVRELSTKEFIPHGNRTVYGPGFRRVRPRLSGARVMKATARQCTGLQEWLPCRKKVSWYSIILAPNIRLSYMRLLAISKVDTGDERQEFRLNFCISRRLWRPFWTAYQKVSIKRALKHSIKGCSLGLTQKGYILYKNWALKQIRQLLLDVEMWT